MTAATRAQRWAGIFGTTLRALLPLVILLTSLRLLLTETFVRLEYQTPDFPADPYGFTLEDRLRWAPIALEYLLNDAEIDFLAELRFDSGEPLYNARELRHMQDVKILSQNLLIVWALALTLTVLLALLLWRAEHKQVLRDALLGGARMTLILMAVLTGALIVSFPVVFVGFHRIFFEGDTWLFAYSDTLIRLFPERFWRDTFIALVVMTVVQGGALWLVARAWRTVLRHEV